VCSVTWMSDFLFVFALSLWHDGGHRHGIGGGHLRVLETRLRLVVSLVVVVVDERKLRIELVC